MARDAAVHNDPDSSAEVETVTLRFHGGDVPEWTGSLQVFRGEPFIAEADMPIKDLRVFVNKKPGTALENVYAKDVESVEIARDKGEDVTWHDVTRVRYEDAGGFELVLS